MRFTTYQTAAQLFKHRAALIPINRQLRGRNLSKERGREGGRLVAEGKLRFSRSLRSGPGVGGAGGQP